MLFRWKTANPWLRFNQPYLALKIKSTFCNRYGVTDPLAVRDGIGVSCRLLQFKASLVTSSLNSVVFVLPVSAIKCIVLGSLN